MQLAATSVSAYWAELEKIAAALPISVGKPISRIVQEVTQAAPAGELTQLGKAIKPIEATAKMPKRPQSSRPLAEEPRRSAVNKPRRASEARPGLGERFRERMRSIKAPKFYQEWRTKRSFRKAQQEVHAANAKRLGFDPRKISRDAAIEGAVGQDAARRLPSPEWAKTVKASLRPSLVKLARESETHKSILSRLEPGDIIHVGMAPRIYKRLSVKGLGESVFRSASKSVQGSMTHTAIYVGDGNIVESRLGEGVREKSFKSAMRGKSYIVLRANANKRRRKKAARFAKQQVGKDYDSTALVMTGAKIALPNWFSKAVDSGVAPIPKKAKVYTCSNLVTAAYVKAGVWSLGNTRTSPLDLRVSRGTSTVGKHFRKGDKERYPWLNPKAAWKIRKLQRQERGLSKRAVAAYWEELVKIASLSEGIGEIEWGKVPDQLSPDIQTARKSARRRFAKIHTALKTQGVDVVDPSDITRISVPKGKLTKDDLKLLGFEPVIIAIPEKGQKTFKSYRHPSSNHHVHDHGNEWVIHEDAHASTTMLWRKSDLQHEGKSTQAPHKLKKPKSTGEKPLSKAKATVQGMRHLITEGGPGLYGYLKGQITGAPDMAVRMKAALPKSVRRRFKKWVPSKTVAPDWVPPKVDAPQLPKTASLSIPSVESFWTELEKVGAATQRRSKQKDYIPGYLDWTAQTAGMGITALGMGPIGRFAMKRIRENYAGANVDSLLRRADAAEKNNPGLKIHWHGMPNSVRAKELGPLGKFKRVVEFSKKMQGGPAYSRTANTIYMAGLPSPHVLEHELGHATGGVGKKILQSPVTRGGAAATAIATLTVAGKRLQEARKTEDPKEREKVLRSARNLAGIGGVALAAPTMLEEARATGRALLKAPKGTRRAMLRTLGPAYATYANLILPMAVATPIVAEYYRRKAKKQIPKTMKKAAALSIPSVENFWMELEKVGAAVTKQDIHRRADALGIAWDSEKPGSGKFLALCKRLTGKTHLDKMSPEELQAVLGALSSMEKIASRTFTNNGVTYDVEKLWEVKKKKSRRVQPGRFLKTTGRTWGQRGTKQGRFGWKDVANNPGKYPYHEKAIQEADLSYPILVRRGVVVDGIHRLVKAHQTGKSVQAIYLSKRDMEMAKTAARKLRAFLEKTASSGHWRTLKSGQTGHDQQGNPLQGKTWVRGSGEAEFAPGIPKDRKTQKIKEVKKPTKWQLVVQKHPAERAGDHHDIRLVDPSTGHAHSWATRKDLPGPGEQNIRVFQQPTHTAEYAREFEGEIAEGYGKTRKGEKVRKAMDEKIEVLEASDDFIRFNIYKGKGPEEFILTRAKKKEEDGKRAPWHLINVTKTSKRTQHLPFSKPKYKEIPVEAIDMSDPEQTMAAKLDGGHVLYELKKGRRPRTYSYRKPKDRKSGIIEHSHKVTGLYGSEVPAEIDTKGTILRGELYAQRKDGKGPVPAETVGGMINAGAWRSRELQAEHGKLRPAIFDVVKFRGKDMADASYDEKLDALRQVKKHMPEFELPDLAFTEPEKKELLKAIKEKTHPQTHEGVILWHRDKAKKPIKAKFKSDHDIFIRKITPAVSKDGKQKDEAGALWYSWTPDGPIVGRVGTGFSRSLRQDMWKRKDSYIGAVAKVTALAKYKSGALGKAAFQGWHIDKNPETFWSIDPVAK